MTRPIGDIGQTFDLMSHNQRCNREDARILRAWFRSLRDFRKLEQSRVGVACV